MVTDKKGYALSDELSFGTYVIRETKTPSDHYSVPDFTVTITEDSREPQVWRVFNDEKFKAVLKIVKLDIETGNTVAIPGATFKIKDLKNKQICRLLGMEPISSLCRYMGNCGGWNRNDWGVALHPENIG